MEPNHPDRPLTDSTHKQDNLIDSKEYISFLNAFVRIKKKIYITPACLAETDEEIAKRVSEEEDRADLKMLLRYVDYDKLSDDTRFKLMAMGMKRSDCSHKATDLK